MLNILRVNAHEIPHDYLGSEKALLYSSAKVNDKVYVMQVDEMGN